MTTSPTSSQTTSQVHSEINATADDLAATVREVKIAAVLVAAFGLLFAVSTTATTDWGVRTLGDIMFLRLGDGADQLTDYNHLADAIAGGVMFGWGVMIWLLADRLLAKAPTETKSIILISLGAWFVVDSAGSIASGAWLNAIANIAFVVTFLAALRRI